MQPNDLVISKSNKQPYVVIKMEKKITRKVPKWFSQSH